MRSEQVIWHNGTFVRAERATINILSHGLHYGTGVFEGIRAYDTDEGTAIFRLSEHVDRLLHSAKEFEMKVPYTKKELEDAIKKTVSKNNLKECYIRPIIFFGEGQMGLSPNGARLHAAIAAWPWGAYLGGHKALSIGISKYVRFHPKSVIPSAKISGFYAASALATIEARNRGFDECILLDHKGYVSEGPGENVFMVKNKKIYTPDSPSILPGITRDTVMAIAKDLGIPTFQKKISLKELSSADEIFLTGTAVEVGAVGMVNRRRIGDGSVGPVTEKIRQAYSGVVHGRNVRRRRWLTLVAPNSRRRVV